MHVFRIIGNALALISIVGSFVAIPGKMSAFGLAPNQTSALYMALAIILLIIFNGVRFVAFFNENERKHK